MVEIGITAMKPPRPLRLQRCGARSKRGGWCRAWPAPGSTRCRSHGGTIKASHVRKPGDHLRLWPGMLRLRAMRKALGLPWYGGANRKPEAILPMVESAKKTLATGIARLEEALPPVVQDRPLHELTPAELLGLDALVGLRRLYEIMHIEFQGPPDNEGNRPVDLKRARLVGDMALGANKLFMRAAEGEYRKRATDQLGELLETIKAERAAKG